MMNGTLCGQVQARNVKNIAGLIWSVSDLTQNGDSSNIVEHIRRLCYMKTFSEMKSAKTVRHLADLADFIKELEASVDESATSTRLTDEDIAANIRPLLASFDQGFYIDPVFAAAQYPVLHIEFKKLKVNSMWDTITPWMFMLLLYWQFERLVDRFTEFSFHNSRKVCKGGVVLDFGGLSPGACIGYPMAELLRCVRKVLEAFGPIYLEKVTLNGIPKHDSEAITQCVQTIIMKEGDEFRIEIASSDQEMVAVVTGERYDHVSPPL
eukprot:GHVU01177864.1.p1 GENE.GHVU01177864.1~~GHVU01177864.1.p1  ORF type:complete len:266 (+),score=35.17 GHVU01177864.1:743-1540(+)